MAKKKSLKKTDDVRMQDENLRVLRELVERGWAELEAKYAAEGKQLPVRLPGR